MHKTILPPQGEQEHIIISKLKAQLVETACGYRQWNEEDHETITYSDLDYDEESDAPEHICNNCVRRVVKGLREPAQYTVR